MRAGVQHSTSRKGWNVDRQRDVPRRDKSVFALRLGMLFGLALTPAAASCGFAPPGAAAVSRPGICSPPLALASAFKPAAFAKGREAGPSHWPGGRRASAPLQPSTVEKGSAAAALSCSHSLDTYARMAVTGHRDTRSCMRSLAGRMTCRECRRAARMYNPALRSRLLARGEESRIPAREAGSRVAQRKARDTWRRNGGDAAMACRASRDRRSPPSPIVRQAIQRSPQAQDLHRRRAGY